MTTAKKPAAAPVEQSPVETITVRAKSAQGRWRAGLHFGDTARVLVLADLGDGVLEELQGDDELIITEGGEPEAAPEAPAETLEEPGA